MANEHWVHFHAYPKIPQKVWYTQFYYLLRAGRSLSYAKLELDSHCHREGKRGKKRYCEVFKPMWNCILKMRFHSSLVEISLLTSYFEGKILSSKTSLLDEISVSRLTL